MTETEALAPPNAMMPTGGVVVRQDITLKELAVTFHQSGFFSDVKSAAQAVVKIMAGNELGISPIASMRGIHVFEGKVELSGPTMAALIKRADKYRFKVVESSNDRCEITFEEREAGEWESCGPNVVFDRQDAVNAELAKFDKDGKNISTKQNWRKYLADMMLWRCLSRGFRRYTSDLAGGDLYVQGEISEAAGVPQRAVTQPQPGPTEDTKALDAALAPDPTPSQPTPKEPSSGVENNPPDVQEGATEAEDESQVVETVDAPDATTATLTRDQIIREIPDLEKTIFDNTEVRDQARVEYLSKPQPAHCKKDELARYHEFLVRMAGNAVQTTLI
jgi:hypothetical protein